MHVPAFPIVPVLASTPADIGKQMRKKQPLQNAVSNALPVDGQVPGTKLAYTVKEFSELTGSGRSSLYAEIRQGRLLARKIGSRTLILQEDGMNYLRHLPFMPSSERR
jgi:hypothetical protein